MLYKILIKNSDGTMKYAQKSVTGTDGIVTTEDFTATTTAEAAAEYVKLLDTYKQDKLDVVADMKEDVTITVTISELNPDTTITT